jgi:hypothetical protein
MPSKSKEGLIHVSDFISLEERLTISQKNAQEIIYLSNNVKYWNIKALLKQVKRAINIFKEKHFNKVAIFVFDQLSAYASKEEGVLNAFNINLEEGGAFLLQKVSYIFLFKKYLLIYYFSGYLLSF